MAMQDKEPKDWDPNGIVWTRVQSVLHQMAERGHVQICDLACGYGKPGYRRTQRHVHVSDELREGCEMLGRFDEQEIKAFLLGATDRGYDILRPWPK